MKIANIIIIIVILAILIILGLLSYNLFKPIPPILPSQNQTTTPPTYPAKDDLIKVTNILPNQEITSPITIKGQARGVWYFEAVFPIQIINDKKEIIGRGQGMTESDWMTNDYVSFTSTIDFNPGSSTSGEIILQKDNPSGLPKNDNELQIPVRFKIALPIVNNQAISSSSSDISLPISDALTRVTKKPFGIYTTPDNSPINPEHFTGYHTGVDFETTPSEQNIDVPIYAICSGPLILKKSATGYGGVAVQSCKINQENITVIYGHLKLESITISLNKNLNQGDLIGILGKGYSTETGGERKHLHLGVHKGATVNILGYVQNKSELSQWIDFMSLWK